MDKINVFKKEYQYLKNEKVIKDTKYLVSLLPDYFFEIPASSTLKYHPKFANSPNGLVKHTKVAVKIAKALLEDEAIGNKFSALEQDLIMMALILHDGLKCGPIKEQYTRFDHPLLMSKFIMEQQKELSLDIDDIRTLCSLIETHMGPWTIDSYTKKEVLPKPKSEIQKFVHMCDYLSSKKFLDVTFNGMDILE